MTSLIILAVLYMLPWFLALTRKHKNCLAIFWLNLLTGWSFFGWVGALIWAVIKSDK